MHNRWEKNTKTDFMYFVFYIFIRCVILNVTFYNFEFNMYPESFPEISGCRPLGCFLSYSFVTNRQNDKNLQMLHKMFLCAFNMIVKSPVLHFFILYFYFVDFGIVVKYIWIVYQLLWMKFVENKSVIMHICHFKHLSK